MDSLRNCYIALSVLIFLFIGCTPLQQAPLVYGSKVTLGIDVSGQTTEQPNGVSINIGYKQIDSAFVPVFVAKKCEKTDDEKDLSHCQDNIYALHKVTAAVGGASGSSSSSQKVKDLINQLQQVQQERETAEASLKTAAGEIASAQVQHKSAASGTNASQKEDASRALAAAKQRQKEAENAKRVADDKYEVLLADFGSVIGTKQDAYSVFGTFAADTQVSLVTTEPKTGLKIGKVFSTGVASQNLTEGLRGYYQTSGGAQCLTTAKELGAAYEKGLDATDTEKKKKVDDFYQAAVKACSVR